MSTVTTYQDYLDSFYTLASAEPETLGAVYENISDGCRDALVLQFTTRSLLFRATAEDDTIGVLCEEAALDMSSWSRVDASEPWKSLVGTVFGWGWVTINQQGYCDGVLLSFDGLVPTVLLCVLGSSIVVRRLVEEEA